MADKAQLLDVKQHQRGAGCRTAGQAHPGSKAANVSAIRLPRWAAKAQKPASKSQKR